MKSTWALITGASAGIGHASALRFAREGYDLILIARREDRLQEVRQEVEALGRKAVVLAGDVTSAKIFEQVAALPQFPHISVLLNNAGLAAGVESVQSAKFTDWERMLDTNVTALFHLTRVVLPSLIANRGHIVNIGSVAGRWTYPGGAVYCATKAAVAAFSEGLRLDLMGTGVRVTNIAPGMVESEFSLVRLGSQEKSDKVYDSMTPLSPEDIAECISWSLSRPKHVNVQEMLVFPTDQGGVGHVHRERKTT